MSYLYVKWNWFLRWFSRDGQVIRACFEYR